MGDKLRWKDVMLFMFKCCSTCHIKSKCSKCCEIEIDPESRPPTPTTVNENDTILK